MNNIDETIANILEDRGDIDEAISRLAGLQQGKTGLLKRIARKFKSSLRGAKSSLRGAQSSDDARQEKWYNGLLEKLYKDLRPYAADFHNYAKMSSKQEWIETGMDGGYWSITQPTDITKEEYEARWFLCDRISNVFKKYARSAPDGGFYTLGAVDNWIIYTLVTSKEITHLVAANRKNADAYVHAWATYAYRKDVFNRNRNLRDQLIDFIKNRQKYMRKIK